MDTEMAEILLSLIVFLQRAVQGSVGGGVEQQRRRRVELLIASTLVSG